MKTFVLVLAFAGLGTAPALAMEHMEPKPIETEAAAGTYTLDPYHASLTFQVNHLGFSLYTAQFETFDATLEFDPADPAMSSLEAVVDVSSLDLPTPPEGFKDTLLGAEWFDAGTYPEITFKSTHVEMTGPTSAEITGDLTLHGITKPATLTATFNGGYAGHPMDPNSRIGFSASGLFKRSDFGIAYGIPAPGTTMGVGDDVTFMIDAEFNGPALSAEALEQMQQQMQDMNHE